MTPLSHVPQATLSVDLNITRASKPVLNCAFETVLSGVLALYGQSGAGKSTLLKAIAGLYPERESMGTTIQFGDELWQAKHHFTAPEARGIGFVFQDQQLLPHLSVRGNLAYAERRAHQQLGLDWAAVVEATDIGSLLDRAPSTLSGGEQQRVGLARTLINQPRLLLLDEPLASLDPRSRRQLIRILLRIKSEFGVPMIYVSHRWDEIVRLADTVLWLESGLLKRYEPLSQLAADFELAKYHLEDAACVLMGRASRLDETQELTELAIGQQSMWIPDTTLSMNTDHRLLIRVQDVSLSLSEHPTSSILNHLRCTVEGIDLSGGRALIRLNCEGQSFLAQIARKSCESLNLEPGQTLLAHIKASVLS